MKSTITAIKSLSKTQILAIAMVVLGFGLVVFFGLRSYRSFKQLQYIEEQGLFTATSSPDAIRPWMTIRFVATAYAVPQEYLFAGLGIPFDRRSSNDTLHNLNQQFEFGRSANGQHPAIIDQLTTIIEQYREDPVAPGLEDDVRSWMSIQYIANSTGIPPEYIFEQIGLSMDGNEYKPLDFLDEEYDYAGGRRALVEAVQTAVEEYRGDSVSLTELDLNELVLTWVITYGSPMVAGILFFGALGIPMPGTLLVIASGAFIRQGYMDIYTTPPVALGGVLAGDIIVYGLGRFARGWIQRRFGQSSAWQNAEAYFRRRGGIAIYLTRWLFTPLAIPTNLIAGSSGYPFWKFLLFDLAGEITWILLYGGLGYAFGSQWELISDFISDFSGLLIGILILAVGIYILFRRRTQTAKDSMHTA